MSTFPYDKNVLSLIKKGWAYAEIPEGDFERFTNESDEIDLPIDEEWKGRFAAVFAHNYLENPNQTLVARWPSVLSSARAEVVRDFVYRLHIYVEAHGYPLPVFDQTFRNWVSYYGFCNQQDPTKFVDFINYPVSGRTAAHLVASVKGLQVQERGEFYHMLLKNSGIETYTENAEAGLNLISKVSLHPDYALLFAASCIYPEVASMSDRGLCSADREMLQFGMSRAEYAKPFLAWLQQCQPEAYAKYIKLEEIIETCRGIDIPANLSVPLLTTTYESTGIYTDKPDSFSVIRDMVRGWNSTNSMNKDTPDIKMPGDMAL